MELKRKEKKRKEKKRKEKKRKTPKIKEKRMRRAFARREARSITPARWEQGEKVELVSESEQAKTAKK